MPMAPLNYLVSFGARAASIATLTWDVLLISIAAAGRERLLRVRIKRLEFPGVKPYAYGAAARGTLLS